MRALDRAAPRHRGRDRLSWRSALAIVFGISLVLWAIVIALAQVIHG